MKAVILQEYGGPQVLNYEETPRLEPNDEVLIRVMAASVNPVDVAIRSGKFAEYLPTSLPLIPGMDVAGFVETRGSKISALKAGDPVYAFFTLREESGVSISAEPKSETFAELTHLIDGRKLAPVVTQVFPLSEVAKAQDQITTRHMRGKIVPRVAPELKSR